MQEVLSNPIFIATLAFCLAAGGGQVLHAVKKWSEGAVPSLQDWLFGNPRRTVAAMIGNGAGMLIFIQTGVLGPLSSVPNGWWAVVLFGFMNGYSADSALNRATKQANAE